MSQALGTLRHEGVRSTAWRAARWATSQMAPFQPSPLATVYPEDLTTGDWSQPRGRPTTPIARPTDGYRVAWLISPPGRTSGGHQNAFRFMKYLEDAGNRLTVFLYSTARYPVVQIDAIRTMLRETTAYPDLRATLRRYDPVAGLGDGFDAVVACDWQTAYAAYRCPEQTRGFYFTQDYEPWFYPPASGDFVAAENSYRLGLHGIVAGSWLARHLTDEFGMWTYGYEYAVDPSLYHRVNTNRRTEVLCYVRPPTPRRATEYALLAMAELARRRPDVVIHLVGWDMSGHQVPFPHVNHAAMDLSQLNAVYNRCAAALLFSLTNTSLVPMEAMSAGVVPIVNDAPWTRQVLDNPHVEFAPLAPIPLADRLMAAIDRPDQVAHAERIARSVSARSWDEIGAGFVTAFDRVMAAAH